MRRRESVETVRRIRKNERMPHAPPVLVMGVKLVASEEGKGGERVCVLVT